MYLFVNEVVGVCVGLVTNMPNGCRIVLCGDSYRRNETSLPDVDRLNRRGAGFAVYDANL